MKILPLGPELFHANGRTDERTERKRVAFRNVKNTSENILIGQ